MGMEMMGWRNIYQDEDNKTGNALHDGQRRRPSAVNERIKQLGSKTELLNQTYPRVLYLKYLQFENEKLSLSTVLLAL